MKYFLPLLLILAYIVFEYSDFGKDTRAYDSTMVYIVLFLPLVVFVISNLLFIYAYVENKKKTYIVYLLLLLSIPASFLMTLWAFLVLPSEFEDFGYFIMTKIPIIALIWLLFTIKFEIRTRLAVSLSFYSYCLAFICTFGLWVAMNAISSPYKGMIMLENTDSNIDNTVQQEELQDFPQ